MRYRILISMGTILACLIITVAAAGFGNAQSGSSKAVMRPVISEQAVPTDGFAGEAFLRKPPGDGPFPVSP